MMQYGINEAARYLALTERTMLIYARSGRIPATKTATGYVFDEENLQKYRQKGLRGGYRTEERNRERAMEMMSDLFSSDLFAAFYAAKHRAAPKEPVTLIPVSTTNRLWGFRKRAVVMRGQKILLMRSCRTKTSGGITSYRLNVSSEPAEWIFYMLDRQNYLLVPAAVREARGMTNFADVRGSKYYRFKNTFDPLFDGTDKVFAENRESLGSQR